MDKKEGEERTPPEAQAEERGDGADTLAEGASPEREVEAFKAQVAELEERLSKVQAAQEELWALVENTEDLLALRDEKGHLVLYNQAFSRICERLFGQPAFVGMRTMDLLPPEKGRYWKAICGRVLGGEKHQEEFVYSFPEEDRFYELALSPIKKEGRISGFTEYNRDITRMKRAEEEYRREARANAALASLAHSMISTDVTIEEIAKLVLLHAQQLTESQDGYVSEVDPVTKDNIGHSLTEMIAGRCRLEPGEQRIRFPRGADGRYPGLWGHCLNTKEPFFTNDAPSHPSANSPPDNHAPLRRFLSVPVLLGDELVGQIALANPPGDYTERDLYDIEQLGNLYAVALQRSRAQQERALLEEQLRHSQKMEAIGTLAGGIAHDFNNILMPILGNTDLLLLELPEEDPLFELIEEIHQAGQRAKELIRQILTISHSKEEERHPIDLTTIVTEATRFLRSSIPKTIEIRNHVFSCGAVLASPTQIHQVLMNLCTNAQQAMKEGGTLELSLREVELDRPLRQKSSEIPCGRYVRLRVRDSGPGISPAVQERIFEPYFTTKEAGEGTGLGLAIVHAIVSHHQGAVFCESVLGQGTTFDVYLPEIEDENVFSPPPEKQLRRGGEHVLWIDDEPSIVRSGTKMLERLGYQVSGYTSWEEAVEEFCRQPAAFDLVITDQTMPRLTGLELAQELHQMRPELPIILATGYSQSFSPEELEERGIFAVLFKPFGYPSLSSTVREALKSRDHEEDES